MRAHAFVLRAPVPQDPAHVAALLEHAPHLGIEAVAMVCAEAEEIAEATGVAFEDVVKVLAHVTRGLAE